MYYMEGLNGLGFCWVSIHFFYNFSSEHVVNRYVIYTMLYASGTNYNFQRIPTL